MLRHTLIPCLLFLCFHATSQSQSTIIESSVLDREIRIYTYDAAPDLATKPIVYFTDGQKLIDQGFLQQIILLSQQQAVPLASYVFVSSINPKTGNDHRNEYFFCNPEYLAFFEKELIPAVEDTIGTSFLPEERALVGVSFGGLSAAWFTARSTAFGSYGLLSPITYPCPKIHAEIALASTRNIKVYLSTGTYDAENYTGPLKSLYEGKGIRVQMRKTSGGHDFENWKAQLPQLLRFLLSE